MFAALAAPIAPLLASAIALVPALGALAAPPPLIAVSPLLRVRRRRSQQQQNYQT
jgi:hypothetical protein